MRFTSTRTLLAAGIILAGLWFVAQVPREVPSRNSAEREPATFRLTMLDSTVLLDENDLVSYGWMTHTMTIRESVRKRLREQVWEDRLRRHCPFLVVVDGVSCYRGTFTTGSYEGSFAARISEMLTGPVIYLDDQPSSVLVIREGFPPIQFPRVMWDPENWADGEPPAVLLDPEFPKYCDPRQDERVRHALQRLGKLK